MVYDPVEQVPDLGGCVRDLRVNCINSPGRYKTFAKYLDAEGGTSTKMARRYGCAAKGEHLYRTVTGRQPPSLGRSARPA